MATYIPGIWLARSTPTASQTGSLLVTRRHLLAFCHLVKECVSQEIERQSLSSFDKYITREGGSCKLRDNLR